jgi:hypothetical protein
MVYREDIVRKLDSDERRFVDRWQLVAACLLLAIYAVVIVWWLVASPVDTTGEPTNASTGAAPSASVHAFAKEAPNAP